MRRQKFLGLSFKAVTALLVCIALVMGGVFWALSGRPSAVEPVKKAQVMQLAQGDGVFARQRTLQTQIPLSGNLKAVQTAWVKARTVGTLQDVHVREGDAVRVGQVLARVDAIDANTRLQQAREQATAAQGQLRMAQRSYDNNKALMEQGFISPTALDNASASLVTAQANYQAALAGVRLAHKTVEDTVLRAPIAGQVSQRTAQNGERVVVEARIVEIIDTRDMEMEAALSVQDAARVRVGQAARLEIQGSGLWVDGRVVRINPSAQTATRSVLVYLSVDNRSGALRHGLFAQGQLLTERVQGVVIPQTVLREDKPQPYVQVVRNQRIAHVPVQILGQGLESGQAMLVVSGLVDGALLLEGQVGSLAEGTAVAVPAQP